MLILIIFNNIHNSVTLTFNNESNHEYYSNLLSNFAINKSELNAINRLIGISNDIDNYDKHLERHHISGKSVVYSITNILKNILRVVKFKNVRIKQFSTFVSYIKTRENYYVISYLYLNFIQNSNLLKFKINSSFCQQLFNALKEGFSTFAECLGCNTLMKLIVNRLIGFKTIKYAILEVCSAFRIATPTVCRGFVDQFEVLLIICFIIKVEEKNE